MSDKRLKFTLESDRQYIGILDEGYDLTGFEVCNLLNSLYQQCEALQDENEQLKYDNFMFKEVIKTFQKVAISERKKLEKENEQLKKEHKIAIDEMITDYKNLEKENEQLRRKLETHKHPLWSTREAERKLSEVTNNLVNEVKKNGLLNEEINQLRIENMRLKKKDDIV